MQSKLLKGRDNLDPYDKRANAYGIRFDTSTIKKPLNWVTLRKYRVPKRKDARNLDIDDPFVGRKFQGRLDDFSNPFKDITKVVYRYTQQMKDGRRFDLAKTIKEKPDTYFNDPGDGTSWTKSKNNDNPWDSGWLDAKA